MNGQLVSHWATVHFRLIPSGTAKFARVQNKTGQVARRKQRGGGIWSGDAIKTKR